MSDRATGMAPSRVVAVLGPTNTGKTHLAVERMLGHASGMIGLPLRLLAREIYDRIVKRRGAAAVALVTGEEKIVPPRAHYFVCTVEAMPMERQVEFLAVDEIQLVADPERGHVFTQRLLHARGRFETMFLGAGTMAPLIRSLVPDVEIVQRERLSTLSYAGSKKLTRLPRRSAIVAFSTEQVYAIAELIRRQRGGAAVVMGSLSPRTRNAQVELFQSGEVDFLVATDAIGMGLNMEVDHVAFAGLRKFDGRRTRWLHAHEIGQIAGRAGRHLRDGTFGVTGEAIELDPDLVEQVVEHRFDPVEAAEWRNARLDFDTLPDLLRSLTVSPGVRGLNLTQPALDETLLRRLIKDEEVARIGRSRGAIMRLWEACQLPDFQKTTLDEHSRLAKEIFEALTGRRGRLTADWIAPRFADLDRDDGQIDQLSARLSGVRTLSYIANRPDWLDQAQGWRDRTKALEERLSDVLHERLTARFVDRRTTALMRALNVREDAVADVDAEGAVVVEGHAVGRLNGVDFQIDKGSSALEDRALRHAARQAVTPEIARRLGRLAADADEAFSVTPDGAVLWRGAQAGQVVGGDWFAPRVRLLGELGSVASRERAQRRLEAWLASEAGRALRALRRLKTAVENGTLKGLPRGIAYRLVEAGGVLDRRDVERDLAALSQVERRTLKTFGVRLGAHSVWLPALMKGRGAAVAQAFVASEPFRLGAGPLTPLPEAAPSPRLLSAFGLRAVGRVAASVELLESLAERKARNKGVLNETDLAELGLTLEQAKALASALKSTRAQQPDRPNRAPKPPTDSPFAALSALTAPSPAPARRKRSRPRRKSA
ncbi:ATP-dependent RNA helicase SUPV3L1/SUV3 [Brevundimonas alba]|uniref:ATP-dependent RNA helicase SUPV3L1/SUV3 n=1 Tax=Brevundimonas alba TaxID=74314 RepID=A0A7X5YLH0_9CAUL|nr:helicase-related protein [Brevundimonas alba]NJC41371.1 ATP-dependent RNA helicase SUPV3L1/SUV3 [Brevundimonas alba]